MKITVEAESFRLAEVFAISRGSRTEAKVLSARISGDGASGRGECVPYARYGESLDSVAHQIADVAGALERDGETFDPAAHLPPGAARNAVDCALWDWRAKRAGRPVHALLALDPPAPIVTAFTLSLGAPEDMRAAAARNAHRPLLKTKLGGEDDMARLEAVREGAPDARIIVDANEGWTADIYSELAPHLLRLGVAMVEQPLPAGADDILTEIDRTLPVCADESCHDRASLAALRGKYDMVNIKLDKTGGLTEALAFRDAARAEGYRIMVGCMVGTSLAMAPAILVAQGAEIVDLDGPLLLAEDRDPSLAVEGSVIQPAEPALWG